MKLISTVRCGDIATLYLQEPASGRIELQIIPASLIKLRRATKRRKFLGGSVEIDGQPGGGKGIAAYFADSLVQFKRLGDAYPPAFAGGLTMRHSASVETLKFKRQDIKKTPAGVRVTTRLAAPGGLRFEHLLEWNKGDMGVRICTRCLNAGKKPVTLEMLSSFSLGGITPFDAADACGRLVFHRYRTFWSAEGRLDSRPVEALHLERSWIGYSQLSERFGQVGSMPVRKFFPFSAIEDTKAGIIWAVQLAHPGSWQMELYRRGDALSLSGGLADREFGHWMKTLRPGAVFETPQAAVTVVQGDLEAACQRLTDLQKHALATQPRSERELPIIFNEWCTSWGHPTHDNLIALADSLKGTPVKYLVIDDGWAERPGDGLQRNGDWIVDRKKFPHGLAATCAAIRKRGLVPGLWFEFEVCTPGSKAFDQTAHHLARDGRPLQVGPRRFWDFRDPWVREFLHERVIRLLKENGIGYLKVDYNETIGLGCDGAESLGEGLRQHLEGVQSFFRRLRKEIPDLVIENCSSGGHRLEPSMQALCAMGSFSDAHETVEIPIIAANLHSLIRPQQSQIWAVLRSTDTPQRLSYSLAATFLGRMALSGDIYKLDQGQWSIVQTAMAFYHRVHPIIRDGFSRRFGPPQQSFRHPQGWQAVVRNKGSEALIVAHTFSSPMPRSAFLPLPEGRWEITEQFGNGKGTVIGNELRLAFSKAFQGQVFHLHHMHRRPNSP